MQDIFGVNAGNLLKLAPGVVRLGTVGGEGRL